MAMFFTNKGTNVETLFLTPALICGRQAAQGGDFLAKPDGPFPTRRGQGLGSSQNGRRGQAPLIWRHGAARSAYLLPATKWQAIFWVGAGL